MISGFEGKLGRTFDSYFAVCFKAIINCSLFTITGEVGTLYVLNSKETEQIYFLLSENIWKNNVDVLIGVER